jgi:superfamily I DNA/RNA helicase
MDETIEFPFLINLNDKQKSVCLSEDNFILTACPGSGKTRTITYRLAYMAKKYKHSKKLNIAITFTNRAADEIENRLIDLCIDTSNVWTGTIHQFCMKYIIRPYSMYLPRLSKGYRIIDEYEKENYVKEIAVVMGCGGRYIDDLYNDPVVMKKYYVILEKLREIDFDMILEYSLVLVTNKRFIAENIGRVIRSIHIDEYQDTNNMQYQILSCIVKANSRINLLFVGDANQAIYGSLGGVAKSSDEIRKLFLINFREECLDGCYRSTQRVVNYYSNYEVVTTGVKSIADIVDKNGVIVLDQEINKDDLAERIAIILKEQMRAGIPWEEICIIAPQWYQIYPMTNRLKKLLPDIHFDAPDISPIKYDPLNVFFLIAKLVFTQNSGRIFARKKIANEILSIFQTDFEIAIPETIDHFALLKAVNSTKFIVDDGIKTLQSAVKNVHCLLEVNEDSKTSLKAGKDNFFKKISDRITEHKLDFDCNTMQRCFKERTGVVINTIHGVKGEEYTSVIAFDLLKGHLPNWKTVINCTSQYCHEETCKLLYVACSRAKENLYLFAERGRVTKSSNKPLVTTPELACCRFSYDL